MSNHFKIGNSIIQCLANLILTFKLMQLKGKCLMQRMRNMKTSTLIQFCFVAGVMWQMLVACLAAAVHFDRCFVFPPKKNG